MTPSEFRRAFRAIRIQVESVPEAEKAACYLRLLQTLPEEWQDVAETVESVTGLLKGPSIFNIVQGNMSNNTNQTTTNTQTITGSTINAPVGLNQTFTNCFNTADAVGDAKLQEALKMLIKGGESLAPQLAPSDQTKVARRIQLITEESAQPEPDKETIAAQGKSLVETVKSYASVAGPVVEAVRLVGSLFGFSV